ncbi:MAG: nuclear transport factor 2 family protein [Actinomycetota bacterium]
MHPNAELITELYSAFAARDHTRMARCYRPEATFSDPVFMDLKGDEVTAMWRMFCVRGTDLSVTFGDVAADDGQGSARWEARYTFAPTGRAVHNRIEASFRFVDGKILEHRDRFDFYRWSRMALGPPGVLLGWSPLVLSKVRKQARSQLDAFIASEEAAR